MQQTDKYKLNKPGVDDPITPVPLNENMDKIEAALDTKADATDTTALAQRVTVLEANKIVFGTAQAQAHVQLGFRPSAVLVATPYNTLSAVGPVGYRMVIEDNGFYTSDGSGYTFGYIAFG